MIRNSWNYLIIKYGVPLIFLDQFIYGNFSDEVTLLGTGAQIATGIIGIDLPADIRDISADLVNWEWSLRHVGQTALDCIGLIPVIGALKYGDEIGTLVNSTTKKGTSIGDLRKAGQKDAHHIIQDASVRNLPGYNTNAAPGVQLPGPANVKGTPHHTATQVQRQAGGGTYAAERRIGYKVMRRSGMSEQEARAAIQRAGKYFEGIGVTPGTTTRIPGNR